MNTTSLRHDFLKIQRYNNAANVPPGSYQNYDLTRGNKIFARTDNNNLYLTNDFRNLKSSKIQECCYYSASNFPLITAFDYRDGTVFEDWMVPPASYRFLVSKEYIDVTLLKKDLGLTEYTQRFYDRCLEDFKKIYDSHDKIYLHYSGGIDSIVCLSFIIKLGFLKKTTLLYYKNLPEISPTWRPTQAFLDPSKIHSRQELWKNMAPRVQNIIEETVTLSDFLHLFNNYEFEYSQSYSTATMLIKYPDGGHIGGHLGNESLLHWILFMDDLLEAGHDYAEFEEICQHPVYAREHVTDYIDKHIITDPDRQRVTLDHKHHVARQRFALNQGPVKFYHPLQNEDSSEDLRRLHWQDIDFHYLLDAKLAREILHLNVGTELDQYITFDGREADDLTSVILCTDKINPNILSIPDNLNHHPAGKIWHQYALSKMHQHGRIDSQCAMSFKALNCLSRLCSGELDLYTPNPQPKF